MSSSSANEDVPYEDIDEKALGRLCDERNIRFRKADSKSQLIRYLIKVDRANHLKNKEIFSEANDPTGSKARAYIQLDISLEMKWARSIANADIQVHQGAINDLQGKISKREECLDKDLQKWTEKEKERLAKEDERVRAYEKKTQAAQALGTQAFGSSSTGSSEVMKGSATDGGQSTPGYLDSNEEPASKVNSGKQAQDAADASRSRSQSPVTLGEDALNRDTHGTSNPTNPSLDVGHKTKQVSADDDDVGHGTPNNSEKERPGPVVKESRTTTTSSTLTEGAVGKTPNSRDDATPHQNAQLKRNITDTGIPAIAATANKKAKSLDEPDFEIVERIEAGDLEKTLIQQKQTFLKLTGPWQTSLEKMQEIREELLRYHPVAVRADSDAFYVVFDSALSDGVGDHVSLRQECQSHMNAVMQQVKRSEIGVPEPGCVCIDYVFSWVKGVERKHEYAGRVFRWERSYA